MINQIAVAEATGVAAASLADLATARLVAGDTHDLILDVDGTVWGRGSGWSGQLGDEFLGGGTASPVPIPVRPVRAIAAGYNTTTLLLPSRSVSVLGDGGRYNSLGHGAYRWQNGERVWELTVNLDPEDRVVRTGCYDLDSLPADAERPPELTDVVDIASGRHHTLALLADGTVQAWGVAHSQQFLETDLPFEAYSLGIDDWETCHAGRVRGPMGIGLLTDIRAIAAGLDFSLALDAFGEVWAWGSNVSGQLGTSNPEFDPDAYQQFPVKVTDGTGVLGDIVAIAAGGYHALALKADGTVYAWGRNDQGALGRGTQCRYVDYRFGFGDPSPVLDGSGLGWLQDVTAISAGSGFSLALKSDGTLYSWGDNGYRSFSPAGQLGIGDLPYLNCTDLPVQVRDASGQGPLTDILGVAAARTSLLALGMAHSLALKSDGTLWHWGSTSYVFQPDPGLPAEFKDFRLATSGPICGNPVGDDTADSGGFSLIGDRKRLWPENSTLEIAVDTAAWQDTELLAYCNEPRPGLPTLGCTAGNIAALRPQVEARVRDDVLALAQRWTTAVNPNAANLTLQLTGNWDTSDIRVRFNRNNEATSPVGTDFCSIRPEGPTGCMTPNTNTTNTWMNLGLQRFVTATDFDDNDFERIVLHEFGHALGFKHEHQGIPPEMLNHVAIENSISAQVLADHPLATQAERDQIAQERFENNFNALVNDSQFWSSYKNYQPGFDDLSIMIYPMDRSFFQDPDSVCTGPAGSNNACFIWNTDLSDGDRDGAGKAYPLVPPDPEPPVIGTFSSAITVSLHTGGVSGCSDRLRTELHDFCPVDFMNRFPIVQEVVGHQLVPPSTISGKDGVRIDGSRYCSATGFSSCLVTYKAERAVEAVHPIDAFSLPATGGLVHCDPDWVEHGGSSQCEAMPAEGFTFLRWGGDCTGTGWGPRCSLSEVKKTATVYARFDEGPVFPAADDALIQALDAPSLAWQGGSGSAWQASQGAAQCGTAAARSAPILDSKTSVLRLTIEGSARLSFHWRVSSEADFDLLQFLVDGSLNREISGDVAWTPVVLDLGPGTHQLQWRYVKDPSESDGEDAGWLDCVEVTPKTQPLNVSLSGPRASSGQVWSLGSYTPEINCYSAQQCGAEIAEGALVTLMALPPFSFRGWTGAGCVGTGFCTVTMDQAHHVTATFDTPPVVLSLTVEKSGDGLGTVTSTPAGIECGTSCVADFPSGTSVTLLAEPTSGSIFSGWSGACQGSGSNPSCTFDLTVGTTALAEFSRDPGVGSCEPDPLLVEQVTFGPGVHTRSSEHSITTEGAVLLQNGAEVTFRAPFQRFGEGFRVALGAVFRARAEAVNCLGGLAIRSTTHAETSEPHAGHLPLSAPLGAPVAIQWQALPTWMLELLAMQGIDTASIDQALLDAQGGWLLFETAQGLLPEDRNGASDIYRLDLFDETLMLVSRTPEGTAGNGPSRYPAADASGDWVVFQSDADDLVAGDDNATTDIFLHELSRAVTTRITAAAGTASAHPALDADGAELLYDRRAADGRRQILLDGLWGGAAPEPLSLDRDEAGGALDNHHPAISADGRYVAYLEARGEGVAPTCRVHVYDRDTGDFRRLACPDAVAADPEAARPVFVAEGAWLEWFLPAPDAPLVIPNPLYAPTAERTR